MVAQNEPAVSTAPRLPLAELQDAIDDATQKLAKALRAYALATPAPGDTRSIGARLIYGEHLALDELTNLLAVLHAQLDDVMPPGTVEHVERKHDLLRDLATGYFIPQAMFHAVDAAKEREEEPMAALFDDVDVYATVALNSAGAALESGE
jgi:hypothetical protein